MSLDLSQIGPKRHLHQARGARSRGGWRRLELEPVSPSIGAEVSGIDLGEPLDEEGVAEIRRALLEYKVLFFRDQEITSAEHVAFARRFGELEVHPFLPSNTGHPELVRFEKDEGVPGVENSWHSDVSWREVPSLGSVLHAIEVPGVGGDTLFADMNAAFEGLPEELRERIRGLSAVHDFSQTFGRMLDAEALAEKQREFPAVRHPVVRTHPETGRPILYVNRLFTSHVVGMPRDESDALLERLARQAEVPEYQCRFRWRANSIAFWDNRVVQHYAASDYWPQRRVMERATIIGDRPS